MASFSGDMRTTDLSTWAKFHLYMATQLRIHVNEETDLFIDLSKIIQELADKNGRLPNPEEIYEIWDQIHPELDRLE